MTGRPLVSWGTHHLVFLKPKRKEKDMKHTFSIGSSLFTAVGLFLVILGVSCNLAVARDTLPNVGIVSCICSKNYCAWDVNSGSCPISQSGNPACPGASDCTPGQCSCQPVGSQAKCACAGIQ